MIVKYFFYDFFDYKVSSSSIPDYTIIKKINCATFEEDWYDLVYCRAVKICKGYLIPINRKEFYPKKVLAVLRGGEACSSEGQPLKLFHYQEEFDISYYLINVGYNFQIKSKDGYHKILMKTIKHPKKGIEFKFLAKE